MMKACVVSSAHLAWISHGVADSRQCFFVKRWRRSAMAGGWFTPKKFLCFFFVEIFLHIFSLIFFHWDKKLAWISHRRTSLLLLHPCRGWNPRPRLWWFCGFTPSPGCRLKSLDALHCTGTSWAVGPAMSVATFVLHSNVSLLGCSVVKFCVILRLALVHHKLQRFPKPILTVSNYCKQI